MDTDLDLPFNDNTKSVNKLEILNEKIESELSKIDLHDYMSYENFDRFVSNAFLDDKNSPGDIDDIVESMLRDCSPYCGMTTLATSGAWQTKRPEPQKHGLQISEARRTSPIIVYWV